ncbi:hypothetical protein K2173_004426 [Erythroxylum novogranatense]|uniref:Arf-GAP domain-containing protein n=1 Tax=Erythroxylum novogranatense TaxID=1862640 RepID=A0AAV8T4F7_9ROSI|nr:hypothetical protein K2173_004426 [Erythroxylum novogranatense]
MNEKANVSKVLNAKHRKILDSLLKLPENRECADCRSKGPRWASVNLGIFICMQCAGIHRSLGVHISKVRSATLDTWLPEQISLIQTIGNEKSNNYWETELPPNYDRVGIENFIRAKYVDKRWIPRDGKEKSPAMVKKQEALNNEHKSMSMQYTQMKSTNHMSDGRKIAEPIDTNATRSCRPVPAKVPQQVIPDTELPECMQNPKPTVPTTQLIKQERGAISTLQPSQVDYATELFNLLCVDDSRGNNSNMPAGRNAWTTFSSAEAETTLEMSGSTNLVENRTLSRNEVGNVLEKPPSVGAFSENTIKDGKNDDMILFEQSSVLSPISVHHQEQTAFSQQQPILSAAATNASYVSQIYPANGHVFGSNNNYLPVQNLINAGYQVPGMVVPITNFQKYIQVGSDQQKYLTTRYSVNLPLLSVHLPSINGHSMTSMSTTLQQHPPLSNPYVGHNGFSSLAQGMYRKQ